MSYYAKVDHGVVVNVIRADDSFFTTFIDSSPGTWIKTSYNTHGGVHYGPDGNPDGGIALRANYAGVGYIYNAQEDVFYAPQPYPSWTISAPTWEWKPPIPYPTDGNLYTWNEQTQNWDMVNVA